MGLNNECSQEPGLPSDPIYLEQGLPEYLEDSLEKMKDGLAKMKRGEPYDLWDCDYCELQSCINVAEVELEITSRQAWYLREKYLDISRDGTI